MRGCKREKERESKRKGSRLSSRNSSCPHTGTINLKICNLNTKIKFNKHNHKEAINCKLLSVILPWDRLAIVGHI